MNRAEMKQSILDATPAQVAEMVLTSMGILILIVGIVVMPSLELTEGEFYLGLLSLVAFLVICFCAGQLAVIRERLCRD